MSHSLEVKEVICWQADDGKIFDTQEKAEAHEVKSEATEALSNVPAALSQYASKAIQEIKNYSEAIEKLNKTIVKVSTQLKSATTLVAKYSRISKLDDEQLAIVDEAKNDIEEYTNEIAKLKSSIESYKLKQMNFQDSLHLPLLAAFSSYKSDTRFANDYQAFISLVIENTADFLEYVSYASETARLRLELNKDSWWDSLEKFPGGPDSKIVIEKKL